MIPKIRKLSKLRPRVKLLTDFYVWDTETGLRDKKDSNRITWHLNARPESFIFGVIYGHNFTKVIHSREELEQEFLDRRYKNKKVFAHNAEYDLGVLYGNIFELDPNTIFNGKFIAASNGVCQFADSGNIFVGQSVKKIGEQLGIKKIGMSGGEYSSSNWNNKDERARDINGCIRDCEIIYEALFRTFEFAGDIKITQASLSMTYYRRFHQPFTIEHNQNTVFFWDSYFGGRCEAFKIGKTNASVIDVNSMYPYAMKHCVFPNPKYLKVEKDISVKKLKQYLQFYEGCVYCTVEHSDYWCGFLPVKRDGKLLFPVGTFTGCWNFNEIRYALESNKIRIKNISKIVYSDRMLSPFTEFVETGFDLKLKAEIEGNEFERDRIKRFLNSLYGKFAQRITEETIYIKDMVKEFDKIQDYQRKGLFVKLIPFNSERQDCYLVLKASKNIDASFSIPSFASYITSFCRVLLLKKLIEHEKDIPVYCDTDSIFMEVGTNIVSSSKLGDWKLEDKIVTSIGGLKNYRYVKDGKDYQRLKGVPAKAVNIGENTYEYENLMKSKEALKRGKKSGVLTKRIKEIKGTYTKRIVLSDGNTIPIKL